MSSVIPAVAHFVWLGPHFPWVNVLAVASAALRGGFDSVHLHCDHPEIADHPDLRKLPGFCARPLEAESVVAAARGGDGGGLVDIYRKLEAPAARANLLRAAILDVEGGVYLDTDTVTVSALDTLREDEAFCGEERIIFPATTMRTRSPGPWLSAGTKVVFRSLCRALPEGWKLFRRFEGAYPSAANNAVVGSAPGGRFIRRFLAAMLALPEARIPVRFALGPHLLQAEVARRAPGLRVHAPPVFYPLPPVISQHWFRVRSKVELDAVLSAETKVVHWYASVENRQIASRLDAHYIQEHASRQLFSALAKPIVDALSELS